MIEKKMHLRRQNKKSPQMRINRRLGGPESKHCGTKCPSKNTVAYINDSIRT